MKRKIIAISMATLMLGSMMAGCNGGIVYEPEEDSTKSYLYVESYGGGYGSKFFEVVANEFEAMNAEKSYAEGKQGVKIDVNESINNSYLSFGGYAPTALADVHVVSGLIYTDFLDDNILLDVTDVVTDELADGKTIEDKLNTEQKQVLKYNDKYYTIPTFAGYAGLTYNVDLFTNNNLFFADSIESPSVTSSYTGEAYTGRPLVRNKNVKKSPGPDGEYNTVDDGLPSSYEEFFYLFDTMLDSTPRITPLISYGGHYFSMIFMELLCASSTANGLKAMLSFDSNGEEIEVVDDWNSDGTPKTKKVVITEENGYYSTLETSRYMALKFLRHLSTNTVRGNYYIDSRSRASSLSNTNAQKLFLESSLDPSQTPIATLNEGVYWYNEAEGTREGIVGTYGEDAENMNLAYMPLPAKEYGTVTEHNGTTQLVVDSNSFYLVVNKKVENNPEKLALAKDFVKFMYSDAMLQKMTVASGIPFALKYDMENEQYNAMPKLAQSFWDVYKEAKDKDAYITGLSLSPIFLENTPRFAFSTTRDTFKAKIDGAETTDAITHFYTNRNHTAKDFFVGMSIDSEGWKKYYK